jgi:chromatin remodeling complex protein RSC6
LDVAEVADGGVPAVPPAKGRSRRKARFAFMKPVKVSMELEAVVGKGPMPRTQVIKKLWAYISRHDLQDKKNKRMIKPDMVLGKVLGDSPLLMFAMTKRVFKHLGK